MEFLPLPILVIGVTALIYFWSGSNSPKETSPKLALKCPVCLVQNVETARKLFVVRGMIIFFRFGTVSVIGCCDCVAQESKNVALKNLLLGWWSTFGIFVTPFALLQNVFNMSRRPNIRTLQEVLRDVGYDLENLTIGSDGLSGEQRNLLRMAAAALKSVAEVEGIVSSEWRYAKEALVSLSDGALSLVAADRLLSEVSTQELTGSLFDAEQGRVILRIAIDVAVADGKVSKKEKAALCDLAECLGFSKEFVSQLLNNDGERFTKPQSDALSKARKTLGVSSSAGIGEIRSAYKRLMMIHHPDRVAPELREEATRKAAEINLAYETLAAC